MSDGLQPEGRVPLCPVGAMNAAGDLWLLYQGLGQQGHRGAGGDGSATGSLKDY